MGEEKTLGEVAAQVARSVPWLANAEAWEAIANAVVAAHEARRWRPIAEALKEGEVIIPGPLKHRNNVELAHWMPGGHCVEDHPPIDAGWYVHRGYQFVLVRPKVFMPLPAPPKEAE